MLYRRWPNRAQLVLAAVRAQLPAAGTNEVADTGSLRGDLLAALRRWRDRYERVGPSIMNGLAAELRRLPTEDLEVVPDMLATIVEQAARRGEIGPHPVPAHIVDDIAVPAIERAARLGSRLEPGSAP